MQKINITVSGNLNKVKSSIWNASRRTLARGVAAAIVAASLVAPHAAQACTSFILPTSDGSTVYGRTMEFAFELKSDIIFIPRSHALQASGAEDVTGKTWTSKYAALGMNALGLPVLTDGMNEKGLTGGVLYFPGYAGYTAPADAKTEDSLAPWDLLSWALTNFATVEEVKNALDGISIVDVKQDELGFTPPLHYTLHDTTGASVVIEPIDGKLVVTDNPIGVMTNTPPIDWHLTNLRNYVNLSPENAKPLKINGAEILPTGQGSGMLGIPGDTTPPSRFVRAAAFVLSAQELPSGVESVRLAEHIANNFDIPKGWIQDKEADLEYTQWTTVADMKNNKYYVKTYDDQVLRGVGFEDFDLDGKEIVTVKMQSRIEPSSLVKDNAED